MSIAAISYPQITDKVQEWILTNCKNCGTNYVNIESNFKYKSQKIANSSVSVSVQTPRGTVYQKVTYSATFSIRKGSNGYPVDSNGNAVYSQVDIDTIMNQLKGTSYLGINSTFISTDQTPTVNGLLTYVGVVSKFFLEHFVFIHSMFDKTNMMLVYESTTKTYSGNSVSFIDDDFIKTVPLQYIFNYVFSLIRHKLRVKRLTYNISYSDSKGNSNTYTV